MCGLDGDRVVVVDNGAVVDVHGLARRVDAVGVEPCGVLGWVHLYPAAAGSCMAQAQCALGLRKPQHNGSVSLRKRISVAFALQTGNEVLVALRSKSRSFAKVLALRST